MLSLILFTIFFCSTAFGGTLCPPRENMYPCTCMNIQISKKIMHTVVHCYNLPDSGTLSRLLFLLKSVGIDEFNIYNSFWEAHKANLTATKAVLPTDWLASTKITEMKFYDSALSCNFACQLKSTCKNTVTIRFSVINSSLSEKMCALCETEKGNAYPWISCMHQLKHFQYSHGKLVAFGSDMFPLPMKELSVLNLTYNEITSVHRDALKNLKNLTMLDLSHNHLETFEFFNAELSKLQFLDLSWNRILEIGNNQLSYLTGLKLLVLVGNNIVDLKETAWKNVPNSFTVDLNANRLQCGCNIRWIKEHLPTSIKLKGFCTSGKGTTKMTLRVAANIAYEKYDKNCNLIKKNNTKTVNYGF